ncbi:hypothetical protein BJ912DRAFT_981117 [Pholiota molesta]|nr:hypothetical protein BJ912DRAFT_981117 [Pholiota molesta]
MQSPVSVDTSIAPLPTAITSRLASEVILRGHHWPRGAFDELNSILTFNLKTLFISFCHNRVLLNWLLYDADIFGVILATVGETLEHLEIGFLEIGTWNHDLDDGKSDHESSESSPAPSSALNSPYRWIPGFISTVKSGSVQTICFKVWLSAENQLNLLPWLDLNAILTDLGVSELAFEISGVGRDRDLVVSWFTKRLAIDSAKTAVEYNFTL